MFKGSVRGMPPAAGYQVARSLLTRTFPLNLGSLWVCERLLNGFTITGGSYPVAALAMTIPSAVFLLWVIEGVPRLLRNDDFPGRLGSALLYATFVAPLLLGLCILDILLAEWLAPQFTISGFWTYIASCAIAASVLLISRQMLPLRWLRSFLSTASTPMPEPGPPNRSATSSEERA